MRNYSNGDGYWITGWNLEGKNDSDCKEWRVIDAQKRSDDLKGKGKIAVFAIKHMKKDQYFNQLRIRITDTMNDQSSWQLALSGFEVYGCLYDAYPIPNGFDCVYTCKYDKKATQKENDENGLFYVLGTNFTKETYTNPYKKCVIDAKSSKLKSSCQISSYIGMQHDVAYCITVRNKQSFVEIDLKDEYLIATDYTLRNYINGDYYWITGWNLEGSNDGKQWNVIDEKRRNNELRGKGKVCHFQIKQKPLCFRIFRT